jgi:hypothetical protein
MASKKIRKPVPKEISALVLFLSDRTCCVCRIAGKAVQIHHLDSDPSNNQQENLAVLCFDCHHKTQIEGGFGKKLDATQVMLYRDNWVKIIEKQRDKQIHEKALNGNISSRESFSNADVVIEYIKNFEHRDENLQGLVKRAFELLEERHKFVLERKYGLFNHRRHTYSEIATLLGGVSPSRIKTVEVQAFRYLKDFKG